MKIGYPCLNTSINCTPNRTFRLKSYSEERLKATINLNLECLQRTLDFNVKHNLLFFRIGSPLIPFASHKINNFNWKKSYNKELKRIGNFIQKNNFRIGMHPDQFVVINSLKKEVVKNSIQEIEYHCDLLDTLGLGQTAKIQIHVGGVYNDKQESIKRFIENYNKLSSQIKKRLVIENDHLSYSMQDCLYIHNQTKIPVVIDIFHHECLNNKEGVREIIKQALKTWDKKDGKLMLDYSSQKKNALKGSHAESIDIKKFKIFLKEIKSLDFDLMLEIKDKEKSALKANAFIKKP